MLPDLKIETISRRESVSRMRTGTGDDNSHADSYKSNYCSWPGQI